MNARTVRALTGITDKSLIRVQASSACTSWSWFDPGSEDHLRSEELEATLWPLSALRSLKVSWVRDATAQGDHSQYEWDAAWVVTLLGGQTISLPASRWCPIERTASASKPSRARRE